MDGVDERAFIERSFFGSLFSLNRSRSNLIRFQNKRMYGSERDSTEFSMRALHVQSYQTKLL